MVAKLNDIDGPVDNVGLREWPNADVIRFRKSKATKHAPLT
jgi:hypothetical protein